ncbi:activator-dependent family glycosyltransferase [Streptomyces sp. ME19-01-6]|uniref:activator-dependent family glycosyltransferase n=1 Tax=Streptomyces sp. ME19-01-6 TaxID=3028686 RepID=UPI0029B35A7C|nr:activator-dependent family glycosyltransferase [Streptomyces sp. ME19-01-6]MDX3229508.1 activator-dependent family glycosyltransferase [Streptomyces sp. ME19-01-6]
MRVLFATVSEKSHLYTMVPLAWALTTAGHEVRVAANPALTDAITGSGLTATPVGTDHRMREAFAPYQDLAARIIDARKRGDRDGAGALYRSLHALLENEATDWNEPSAERETWASVLRKYQVNVEGMYRVYNDGMVDDLVELARAWRPDLVIWSPLTYAAPVAARVVGAAHARLLWNVDIYPAMRGVFLELAGQQPAERREDPLAEWLTGHLRRHGSDFAEEATTGQWTIDQGPASLQLPLDLTRVAVRYAPYNGPSVEPDWVRRAPDRPRVCFTPGSSSASVIGASHLPVHEILDAVDGLDIEFIASIPAQEAGALRRVPANTRVVDFVPLHTLVPSCSAVIHHGGFGGWSAALLHGVPQFLLPIRFSDWWAKATLLDAQGGGAYLHASEVTAETLRAGLVRLLEQPSYRASAARLRQEMLAAPTPNDLVPTLEKLTELSRDGAAARG